MTDFSPPPEWRRSPKHILRIDAIDRATRRLPPGRFVEVGAGNGDITRRFAVRGFHGHCYDLGAEARAHLRRLLAGQAVDVVDDLGSVPPASADYLFAFEVLEHIEDDRAALLDWLRLLRPGGTVVLSVPAHQRKFGVADRDVGHVRRYERVDLVDLLSGAGVEVSSIRCWGFPLGAITRRANALVKGSDERSGDHQARSIDSGMRTDRRVNIVARAATRRTLAPFRWLQRAFEGRDLGEGYVVVGRYLGTDVTP